MTIAILKKEMMILIIQVVKCIPMQIKIEHIQASPYLILFSIKLIQLQLNYLFTLTLLKTSFIELKGWSENY